MIGRVTQAVAMPFIIIVLALGFFEDPFEDVGPMASWEVGLGLLGLAWVSPIPVLLGKLDKEEVQQE